MSGEKKFLIGVGLTGVVISVCLIPIGVGFLGLIPSFMALRAAGRTA